MDGGAYCTLTPVVLSRGAIHAGGPYRCPNVRIRARATRTNTPPNGAFRGFGAPQTDSRPRPTSTASPTRWASVATRDPAAQRLRARRHDADRPGPALERGRRGGPRARGRGGRVRPPAGPQRRSQRARGPVRARSRLAAAHGRDRVATGVGLALAWHGAGFTGSGEVKLASVASLELTAEGAHPTSWSPRPRWGRGPRRSSRSSSPTRSASRSRPSRSPRRTRPIVPDSGPTVASRTAMVVGGLLIKAARPTPGAGRGGDRRHVRATYRDYASDQRRAPHRPALRAISGRRLRRRDLPRRRLPGVRLGGLRRERRRRSRYRRGPGPRHRRRRRHRPGHPPGPGRGPGRGRHAPGGRLRDDRGDQAARRPLPQRPARDLHHPDLARRAADHDDPGRGAVRRACRTAPRASGSCRWTSGPRP